MKVVFRDSNFCSENGEDDIFLELKVIPRKDEMLRFDRTVLSEELTILLDLETEEGEEPLKTLRAQVEEVYHIYSKKECFIEVEMSCQWKPIADDD